MNVAICILSVSAAILLAGVVCFWAPLMVAIPADIGIVGLAVTIVLSRVQISIMR